MVRVEFKLDCPLVYISETSFICFLLPGTEFYWDNPSKVGSKVTEPDGSSYYRGSGTGTSVFITHSRLKSRSYIKGDDAFFLFSLEGVESFRM